MHAKVLSDGWGISNGNVLMRLNSLINAPHYYKFFMVIFIRHCVLNLMSQWMPKDFLQVLV